MTNIRLLTAFLFCNATIARGEPSAPADKSSFTLWNPTPVSLRRAYNTDRPSKTDSPYTIDAGVFQVETDAINLTIDHRNPERADVDVQTLLIGQSNLKLGLTNNVDLQILLQGYANRRTSGADFGPEERAEAFGDTTVRLKVNVIGNDGGKLSMALIPFVKVPTSTKDFGNNVWEPGLVLPAAIALPAGFSVFGQTRVDILREAPGTRRIVSSNSLGVSRVLVGNLTGYAEFFSTVSTGRDRPWSATADIGLAYQLSPNMSVDLNSFVGLTRSADDLNITLGLGRRF